MSRRLGSKDARPRYVSGDRLNKKALRASVVLLDFIDTSLENNQFNKLVDYDAVGRVYEQLSQLSKMKPWKNSIKFDVLIWSALVTLVAIAHFLNGEKPKQ